MRKWVQVSLELQGEGLEPSASSCVADLLKGRIFELFKDHHDYSTFADTANVNVRVIEEEYIA
jgi:hypothetical protein